MGPGRRVGLQLKAWLDRQAFDLTNGAALSNHLIDALGADERFRGPLRDLAFQPLFRQALTQRGSSQRAALDQLNAALADTYTPAVLQELQDLLEAATDLSVARTSDAPMPGIEPAAVSRNAERSAHPNTEAKPATGQGALISLAPGLGLAAGSILVLWWAAGRLDALLPGQQRGGGGVMLALILLFLQALALGPMRSIRRGWPLDSTSAVEPSQAWRWVLAPWIHARSGEGLALGVALLLLLASAPKGVPLLALQSLDLATVVLRYGLTALATTVPAVLCARLLRVPKVWSGSTPVVAALVSVAALESLLQHRVIHVGAAPLLVPAWVLLLLVTGLELQAELQPQPNDTSRPWQRLLASGWCWGTLLGLAYALGHWIMQAVQHLQAAGQG